MTDSLADLLSNKNFDEPPEMQAIKHFVRDSFDEDCEVLLRERDIVVSVRSSSLAGALRLKLPELRKRAKITKKIILRIR
ncbi:MAG TPA: hypothetical protein VF261_02430 [Candidatus Saccharimonadales bacterium]